MTVLADSQIRDMVNLHNMIEPFSEKMSQKGVISHGLSSYGYDVRLGRKYKIFHNLGIDVIDPLEPPQECFAEHEGDFCIIPPNSYVLAHTMETFRIPRDVLAICLGKSTYARWGVIVNVTPLEPEWEGTITLEVSNATPRPIKIHSGQGICQLIFLRGEIACETSYKDRNGKYQGQKGITLGCIAQEKIEPVKIEPVYNLDVDSKEDLRYTLEFMKLGEVLRVRGLNTSMVFDYVDAISGQNKGFYCISVPSEDHIKIRRDK